MTEIAKLLNKNHSTLIYYTNNVINMIRTSWEHKTSYSYFDDFCSIYQIYTGEPFSQKVIQKYMDAKVKAIKLRTQLNTGIKYGRITISDKFELIKRSDPDFNELVIAVNKTVSKFLKNRNKEIQGSEL